MLQAVLTAAPYVLNALGGLFGNKKKYFDPQELEQKYGAKATSDEAQKIMSFILNSPYGQELMKGAAESGQALQTQMGANAAASGLSDSTGGSSGASTFAAAAAPQAQAGLERATKASIWQQALPIAAQNVQQRAGLAMQNQRMQAAEPSPFQRIAGAAGQLAQMTKKPGEEE